MTTTPPRILVFAGSNRKDSLNRKLAHVAAQRVQELGAHATVLELADYPLPLFDGDLEAQGHPDILLKLKKVFVEHDALVDCQPRA
jgi:chromate reductase